MSATLTRMPLLYARGVAQALIDMIGIAPDLEPLVVGSIRRQRPDVGDIEIVCALPEEGALDQVYYNIGRLFTPPPTGDMFDVARERPEHIGRILQGWNEGFRAISLEWHRSKVMGPDAIKVQIYRYDAGLDGNRGWITMIRTGPDVFGQFALAEYKRISGGCSDEGYPRTKEGKKVPVSTEEQALALCGLRWIPPEARDGYMLRSRTRRF